MSDLDNFLIQVNIYDVSTKKEYLTNFPEDLYNYLYNTYRSLFYGIKSIDLKNYFEHLKIPLKTTSDLENVELISVGRNDQMNLLREILKEQLEYLYFRGQSSFNEQKINEEKFNMDEYEEKDCNVWFIVANLNSYPYGGVFVFQNKNDKSIIMFQGISKFAIPGFVSITYPSLNIPKLNEILIPEIENLAIKIGGDTIIVSPVGTQGEILIKHYGFKQSRINDFPCKRIRGQLFPSMINPFYEKHLK